MAPLPGPFLTGENFSHGGAPSFVGENAVVIDTGYGKGGFLTILELPVLKTYESR